MSEFHIEVVRVGPIVKHENADTLGIVKVYDYPAIVRLGDFHEGDLAVYIPVDAVVPDNERFAFLGGHRRIEAKRLRGVFSMGLLVHADPGMVEGQDVAAQLGIERYEPPEPAQPGEDDERDPGFMPTYTDIEGLRRWPGILMPGEEVVVTEKVHGACGRWCWHNGRAWAGSRTNVKAPGRSIWWRAAECFGLVEKLARCPDIVFYGEVLGDVRGYKYGYTSDMPGIAIFDALRIGDRTYLDHDECVALCERLDLPMVPQLYRGPWHDDVRKLAEGQTLMSDLHLREGLVVKPVHERWHDGLGRVILKLHGEGFLTHKKG